MDSHSKTGSGEGLGQNRENERGRERGREEKEMEVRSSTSKITSTKSKSLYLWNLVRHLVRILGEYRKNKYTKEYRTEVNGKARHAVTELNTTLTCF